MLPKVFILIVIIYSTNGFPRTNPVQDYNTAYQNPELQQVLQEPINEDYSGYDDSESTFVGQEADLTIRCYGKDKICVKKNYCVNGYVRFSESISYPLSTQEQQCNIRDEVCCILVEKHPEDKEIVAVGSANSRVTDEITGENAAPAFTQNVFAIPTHVQSDCAAALLCVEDKFCTMDGTISPEPVLLTDKQLLRRVPLNSCRNPQSGIIGKCCRDPNYVDPWPTENLPANYSGGFDEKGFPTFLNIAKVKFPQPPVQSTTVSPHLPPLNHVTTEETLEPMLIPEDSVPSSNVLYPPSETDFPRGSNVGEVKLQCGVRNLTLRNPGMEESETVFAEIPWQAMVLHSNDRKILCSGALLDAHYVLTAASCVDRFKPKSFSVNQSRLLPTDVSIKLGEWKLGYELKHEEPLPFEIISVSSINIHPGYIRGLETHDLALLRLEHSATFDIHVSPLCLSKTKHPTQESRCIATGWGKSILQAHYAGSIMHAVSLNILTMEQCKDHFTSVQLSSNTAEEVICGTTKEERNNVCEADIGGPLACENEYGLYELRGIYSQDTGCLSADQAAIFAASDDKWITEIMFPNTGYKEFTTDYRDSTLLEDNQYLPPY